MIPKVTYVIFIDPSKSPDPKDKRKKISVFQMQRAFNAAIKACEAIDTCVKTTVESCLKNNYTVIIISDHGNCDKMINEDGSPNTAHTKNLVPIILINSVYKTVSNGILANIAPTILKIMGIEIPKEMNVKPLV